jgi:hypothetical protein
MWWHEIVNDTLGSRAVLVTYCPLTGSGIAFDPRVNGENGEFRRFGVSGLLYENNLIMFDRLNESLWNQMLLGAQCGPDRGTDLARLPIIETTWGEWKRRHPLTTVLTTNTGHERSYGEYPYGDYAQVDNDQTLFPSSPWDRSRPPKELVLGITEGDEAVAYPFGLLGSQGQTVAINDAIGGRSILVTFGQGAQTAQAFDRTVDGATLTFAVEDPTAITFRDIETGSLWRADGVAVDGPHAGRQLQPLADAYTVFWFAWSVFHPGTGVADL